MTIPPRIHHPAMRVTLVASLSAREKAKKIQIAKPSITSKGPTIKMIAVTSKKSSIDEVSIANGMKVTREIVDKTTKILYALRTVLVL